MPMKRNSTLVYFVNKFYVKHRSDQTEIEKLVENSLATMVHQPSEQCIKNILDFASSYEVLETDSTGHVEMNLN